MAKTWNPGAPAVLGDEFLITDGADSQLQAFQVRDLVMPSTQAESVTGFAMQINDAGGAVEDPPSTLLEVIPSGSEAVTGPVLVYTARPNADGAGSDIGLPNWRREPGTATTNLWQAIDEPVVYPPSGVSAADFVASAGPTPNQYRFHLSTAAFPAGARVLTMKLRMICSALHMSGTYTNRKFTVRIMDLVGGGTYVPVGGGALWATGFTTLFELELGEINPFTDLPWTPADIQEFDGGDYVVRVETVANTSVLSAIIAAEVQIEYLATENRVAAALWRRPTSQAPGIVSTTGLVALPGGGATWSKPSSGTHIYRWRIPRHFFDPNPTSATTMWRTAAQRVAGLAVPHGVAGRVASINGRGLQVSTAPSDYIGNLQLIVGGSPSSDSQPYWSDNVLLGATSALSVGQRFTPGSTQSYLSFRFLVKPPDTGGTSLTLTIRRTSDNVQFGGSYTITADAARALAEVDAGNGLRMVAGFLSAATGSLVSGTQYEFRFTVTGSGTWSFPDARADGAGAVSFGGITGCRFTRTEPGAVVTTSTDRDLPALLLQQPPSIGSPSAEAMLSPTRLGSDCFCGVSGIEHVVLRWTSAAVTAFHYIEMQRYIDDPQGSGDWHQVARKFSNPSAGSWTDREVPRGVAARYRLRYLDTNGSFSEWVETGFATPQAQGCELIFTSNEAPEMTVVYQHEPQVGYDLRGFDNDVVMEIDGADYAVAFVELEDRGIADTRRIIANFGRQPCDDTGRPYGKRRVFQPLRDAVRWPGLPYVCVLDSDGNRTFAYVGLDRAESEEPGWRYHLDATIVPISSTPTSVDVA